MRQLCAPPPDAYAPCYQAQHPYPITGNPATSQGDDGGDPTGTPTTGDSETGQPEDEKNYLCTEVPYGKCFYYHYGTETSAQAVAIGANRSECWGAFADQPKGYCAYGTQASAANACTTKCKMDWETRTDGLLSNKTYIWDTDPFAPNTDTWGPSTATMNYQYSNPGDCDSIPDEIVETTPEFCLGNGAILPAWDGVTPLKKFLATVMYSGTDGGSTSQTPVRGYMAYTFEGCNATSCDLIVSALETSAQDLTGIYTTPDGAQSSYVIEGFELRINQPIVGKWYTARGSVVFPVGVATGKAWMRAATLESLPVQGEVSLFDIDQIVGTHRNGRLSLSFALPQGGSTTTVTLTTQ